MIIGIRFLNGFHGGDIHRNGHWPPTPARLFSALINAMYTLQRLERSNAYHDLLSWLEEQAPPNIYFVEGIKQDSVSPIFYVPAYTGSKTLKNLERTFPSKQLKNPNIYFEWPEVETPPEFYKIVQCIEQLGSSRSMVIAKILDKLPEAKEFTHIKPDDTGRISLPCYYPGYLAASDQAYQNGETTIGIDVFYQEVKPEKVKPINFIDEAFIFKISGEYKLNSTHAALLGDVVRSKLLAIARNLNLAPSTLIGKEKNRHIAFLSLPFVGKYGNGEIFGMSIALPEMPDSEKQDILKIISKFNEDGGNFRYRDADWHLSLVQEDDATPKTLTQKTWSSPSNIWRTVLPAEINWTKDPQSYIGELCLKMGLPVTQVISRHAPFFNGVDECKKYISRNKIKNRNEGFLTHVEIQFSVPIRGPLFIGNTANFGLGIMRPVYER